jgi:hypothetical protein
MSLVVIPHKKALPRPAKFGLVGLAVVVTALLITELTGLTHIIRKPAPKQLTITASSATNASSDNNAKGGNKATDHTTSPTANPAVPTTNPSPKDPSSDSPSNGTTTPSSAPLNEPVGTFVSNHMPGQNGSPTQETSTCTSTPSASCTIKFTMGEYERTLAAKTVGPSGTVSWSWDIADYSFPAGKWQVTASATLNGQTKTTADPQPLEIK